MKLRGRKRRHRRITKNMTGSAAKPRMVVFRSGKHIYAQFVNDHESKVMAGVSTLSKEFVATKVRSTNIDGARQLGKLAAKTAKEKGIKEVCFDRGGYSYHGRVQALAEGAREGGLHL